MKKKLLCLIAVLFFLINTYPIAHAKDKKVDNSVSIAVKKYKNGNYTGCIQDCIRIAERNPSAIAYYYLAMSYVQAEKRQEAINAYSMALGLNPGAKLAEYATTGKRCLETPEQCYLETPGQSADLDSFIASPVINNISTTVKGDIEQKRLNNLKNEINNGKELDDYTFKNLNKSSADEIQILALDKIAQNKPTEDEVKAAMKVLNDAGMSYYPQQNPYMQDNAELMQLNAMMGGGNQYNNNNNSMMNMLPYMMMQNKNGENNYSPQMMQTAILNSMMNSVNYNVDGNK